MYIEFWFWIGTFGVGFVVLYWLMKTRKNIGIRDHRKELERQVKMHARPVPKPQNIWD